MSMTSRFINTTALFSAIALLNVSAVHGHDCAASLESFSLNPKDPIHEFYTEATGSPPFAIQLRIDFYIPSPSATTLYESVDLKGAFPKGLHIAAWTVSRLKYETTIFCGSSAPVTAKGHEVNGNGKFNPNIGYKF